MELRRMGKCARNGGGGGGYLLGCEDNALWGPVFTPPVKGGRMKNTFGVGFVTVLAPNINTQHRNPKTNGKRQRIHTESEHIKTSQVERHKAEESYTYKQTTSAQPTFVGPWVVFSIRYSTGVRWERNTSGRMEMVQTVVSTELTPSLSLWMVAGKTKQRCSRSAVITLALTRSALHIRYIYCITGGVEVGKSQGHINTMALKHSETLLLLANARAHSHIQYIDTHQRPWQ